MQYTILGNSDLKVSRIGFGCMSLSGTVKENQLMLDTALEKGINFFDTADLYDRGQNEQQIGNILHSRRKQLVLATKVGNQYRADGTGWDWNPSKDYIISSVEGSLKRLNTDYIDLYQLHGGTIEDPIDETIAAFELLKQQGKIRHYGISSIRPNVIREYLKRAHIVSIMMQYSLLDRRPEEECFGLLEAQQIGVLSRGALAQGLLAGKQPAAYLGWSAAGVGTIAAALKDIAADNGLAATAIRFVLQQKPVDIAVIGIRTQAQLEDVLKATSLPLLNAEEMKALTTISGSQYYTVHR